MSRTRGGPIGHDLLPELAEGMRRSERSTVMTRQEHDFMTAPCYLPHNMIGPDRRATVERSANVG
jgi:hypothetical protein